MLFMKLFGIKNVFMSTNEICKVFIGSPRNFPKFVSFLKLDIT